MNNVFEFKVEGVEELKRAIDKIGAELYVRLIRAMKRGMHLWQTELIKEQMSGRVFPLFGLNRKTGNLARSWRVVQNKTDSVISGTTTSYAKTHQFGDDRKHIPKRLYVIEDFQTSGAKIIMDEVNAAMKTYR